jgi:hypothetical protein
MYSIFRNLSQTLCEPSTDSKQSAVSKQTASSQQSASSQQAVSSQQSEHFAKCLWNRRTLSSAFAMIVAILMPLWKEDMERILWIL